MSQQWFCFSQCSVPGTNMLINPVLLKGISELNSGNVRTLVGPRTDAGTPVLEPVVPIDVADLLNKFNQPAHWWRAGTLVRQVERNSLLFRRHLPGLGPATKLASEAPSSRRPTS